MRYLVIFDWGPVIAEDNDAFISFDHRLETLHKRGWETALQAIHSEYPRAEIHEIDGEHWQHGPRRLVS